MTNATDPRFIGLFTEEGLYQICSTPEEAAREKRDFRDMGCSVCQHEAPESDLHDIDEKMREGMTFTRARALVVAERVSLNLSAAHRAELEAASEAGPRSLSAAGNPDAPKRPSRAALRAMAEDADARPIARELAAMGLAAVSTDSGAFPLYAFRDGRPICPDELDSMIYEIV